MHNTDRFLNILLITSCLMTGCATNGTSVHSDSTGNHDPYENFNRSMFSFNDKVDGYVAKPISDTYKKVTPQLLQTSVFNFFNNLKNVNVVINDTLQAKFEQSAKDTGRLAINSTLGLGGIVDVAKELGLEQTEEDFDQTLAVWGVPTGSYLVLPLIGPSTMRGIPGVAFDTATNPSTYMGAPLQVVSLINTRASAEGSLQFINEAALDPYVFTRESFLQWRNHLSSDGNSQANHDVDDLYSDEDKADAKSQTKPSAGVNTSNPNPAETNSTPTTNNKLSLEPETNVKEVVRIKKAKPKKHKNKPPHLAKKPLLK